MLYFRNLLLIHCSSRSPFTNVLFWPFIPFPQRRVNSVTLVTFDFIDSSSFPLTMECVSIWQLARTREPWLTARTFRRDCVTRLSHGRTASSAAPHALLPLTLPLDPVRHFLFNENLIMIRNIFMKFLSMKSVLSSLNTVLVHGFCDSLLITQWLTLVKLPCCRFRQTLYNFKV